MMMFNSSRRRKDEPDGIEWEKYRDMLEYGHDEISAKQRLARFGCLGGLIAFVLMCVLLFLGIWYPDFWFGIAVIGVPVLAILWAVLLVTAFIAQV